MQEVLGGVKNLEIHGLGIGKDHNPLILDKLIEMKSTRSSYQFIKEPEDVEISFQVIKEVMCENFLEVGIQIGKG